MVSLYTTEVEAQFQALPTWAPDGDKWFIPHHGCFYLGKGALGNHLTGGCVGPWAGVDALEKYSYNETN